MGCMTLFFFVEYRYRLMVLFSVDCGSRSEKTTFYCSCAARCLSGALRSPSNGESGSRAVQCSSSSSVITQCALGLISISTVVF